MFKKIAIRILVILIYLLVIIEDVIWTTGNQLIAKLATFPIFKQIEIILKQLPPYGALASIALPVLLLFPANIMGLYLISHKLKIYGMLLLICIKIIGTMIMARLFTINKDKLLSINWFKFIHDFILNVRNKAVEWLHSQTYYKYIHLKIQHLKKRKTFFILRIRRRLKRGRISKLN